MPHYRNNREAKEGDPVIAVIKSLNPEVKDSYYAGVLHSINAQAETCNTQLTIMTPYAGNRNQYVSLKDCLHAEDAFTHYVE